MELVSASSESEGSYLYINIELKEVSIPDEVITAENGDYDTYITEVYRKAESSDQFIISTFKLFTTIVFFDIINL